MSERKQQRDAGAPANGELRGQIERAEGLLDVTGNKIHAVELIVLCHKAGIPPPPAVMGWLVDGLGKWYAAQWQEKPPRLDAVLGLRVRQGRSELEESLKYQGKEPVMIEMVRLKAVFDLSNDEAADMVASLNIAKSPTHWPAGVKRPKENAWGADRLKDVFEREKWIDRAPFLFQTLRAHAHEIAGLPEALLKKYPREPKERLIREGRIAVIK